METSKKLYAEASQILVGGVNSPVRAFNSVGGSPLFIKKGEGAYVYDADGKPYIDFVCSWGPLILGHAPETVLEKLQETLKQGWSFGAPVENEIRLAEAVLARHSGLDKIRFVSSGTEATMSALRLARGVTGRDQIVKFAGCYHGHVDALLVEAGSGMATLGTATSAGISAPVAENTHVLEFNDAEGLKQLMAKQGEQIAAVIVEIVSGNMGVILPSEEFIKALQDSTTSTGALLIVDEVMTGFRVGYSSARDAFDIPGDIVTFGKVIGGGLPVGAYAASHEIMNHISPLGDVYQAGTLSGNPLAMTAGLATLEELTTECYSQLNQNAHSFAEQLKTIFNDHSLPCALTQIGSMMGFYFCDGPVRNFSEAKKTDTDLYARFFHACLDESVFLAPSAFEALFISTAHSEDILNQALEGMNKALKKIL